MAEPSMRMGIVQHDKDDGDINGTIECYRHSFVPDHHETRAAVYSIDSRAVALQGCAAGYRGSSFMVHADGRLVKNRRHDLTLPAMPECQLIPPRSQRGYWYVEGVRRSRSAHRLSCTLPLSCLPSVSISRVPKLRLSGGWTAGPFLSVQVRCKRCARGSSVQSSRRAPPGPTGRRTSWCSCKVR